MSTRRRTTAVIALALLLGLGATTLATAPDATAATTVVSRTKAIGIPDAGAADLYPSSVAVAGLAPSIQGLTVTLSGLTHAKPTDLDIEVVGPTGVAVPLMSDVCGAAPLSDVTLTFDDAAPATLPDGRGCATGSWRPTDLGGSDTWAVAPTATSLAAFAGTDPNGAWRLYVRDDNDGGGAGAISGGWSLSLTTGDAPAVSIPGPAGLDGSGVASPYPLTIAVSGLTRITLDVDVTLPGLTHPAPGTLEVLLVSPAGTGVLLMSSTCGRTPFAGVTLTFDDQAERQMSPALGTCTTGTVKPSAQDTPPSLPAPAPVGPYAERLSAFKGQDPNGVWSLFVLDTANHDFGYLAGTPVLGIRTDTRAPNTTVTKRPRNTTRTKAKVKFASSEAGSHFQCRVDRRHWHRCTSPLKLKHLRVGRHRVQVRAVDAAGNVDTTPATVRWRVKPRR